MFVRIIHFVSPLFIAVFSQARRVSGHICVLGLQFVARPGESVVIYVY